LIKRDGCDVSLVKVVKNVPREPVMWKKKIPILSITF